jgi:hypothetical protein
VKTLPQSEANKNQKIKKPISPQMIARIGGIALDQEIQDPDSEEGLLAERLCQASSQIDISSVFPEDF